MAKAINAFIDEIVWESAPRRIGDHQWRAIVYTLPVRYGIGLKRFAYQYRRAGAFGSAPELWTDAQDYPGYARYLPNSGLPKQLRSLRADYEADINPKIGLPVRKGAQLSLAL